MDKPPGQPNYMDFDGEKLFLDQKEGIKNALKLIQEAFSCWEAKLDQAVKKLFISGMQLTLFAHLSSQNGRSIENRQSVNDIGTFFLGEYASLMTQKNHLIKILQNGWTWYLPLWWGVDRISVWVRSDGLLQLNWADGFWKDKNKGDEFRTEWDNQYEKKWYIELHITQIPKVVEPVTQAASKLWAGRWFWASLPQLLTRWWKNRKS